jgi:hypothetical protein
MSTEPDDQKRSSKARKRTSAAPAPETENTIRPLKLRGQAKDKAHSAESSVSAGRAADSATPGSGAKSPQSGAIPDGVFERFIGIGGKYYFPGGELAFVDRGQKLTTRSENVELVRSLVSIAQARNWGAIAVSGTERFRKEAWVAAQAVGLTVKGYTPTELEQAQLVRALAKHRAAGRQGQRSEPFPAGKSEAARSDEDRQAERGAAYTGKLLDHGYETYRRDPLEGSSYFVRLKTKDGEREIWGVDLERAIKHSLSGAKIGDEVTVRAVRRKAVTVSALERDEEGEVIGRKPKATHRNDWIVERTDFLAERQQVASVFRDEKITPQQAVRKHPELQGSYLKLQAVRLGAERDFPDLKTRQQLLDRARVLIAESIERGEPMDPVALRENTVRRPQPRAHQPDPPRAR